MNLDLEERLRECGVTFSRLSKSEKVKILKRWTKEFPELVASARHGQDSRTVLRDTAADRLGRDYAGPARTRIRHHHTMR